MELLLLPEQELLFMVSSCRLSISGDMEESMCVCVCGGGGVRSGKTVVWLAFSPAIGS